MDRKQSLVLLEAAFDSGIRHFDVAPSYGYGEAEGCLGELVRRHRGAVTVTTKFGIAAADPKSVAEHLRSAARNFARPLVQHLPVAKRALASAAVKMSAPSAKAAFGPRVARLSLERSLRELQTDRIDLWLLHEVTSEDLATAESDLLFRFLEQAVTEGKVGAFGIASGKEKIEQLVAAHPGYCETQQYEWSVFDAVPANDAMLRLHHRALTENFRGLEVLLAHNSVIASRWSADLGVDVAAPGALAHLMLAAALTMNPQSVILFSSKRPSHIAANVRVATAVAASETERQRARCFYALVDRERQTLLTQLPARRTQ